MATTISSGTNPYKLGSPPDFGTLYSGRALEFDGVTDYVASDIIQFLPITFSFWIYPNEWSGISSDRAIVIGWRHSVYDQHGCFAQLTSAGLLEASCHNDDSTFRNNLNHTLTKNTWQHIAVTFDTQGVVAGQNDSTSIIGTIYADGVQVDTLTAGGGLRSSATFGIGRVTDSPAYFPGKLTNLQIWDKVWSLSDVQYAYTHPEKLITDNSVVTSGTTISNLKAWYPCTEGNPRSPQTTVYDGSPKELGSELITNDGFDTWAGLDNPNDYPTGWDIGSFTPSGTEYLSNNNNACRFVGAGTGVLLSQSNVFTINRIYKITYEVKEHSQGQIRFKIVNQIPISTEVGIHSFIVHNGSVTTIKIRGNSPTFDTTINNISVKEVQMGNHGTTKFYGTELITVANDRDFENNAGGTDTSEWLKYGGGVSNIDGGTDVLRVNYQDNTSNWNGAEYSLPADIITGRTYRFTLDLERIAGTVDKIIVQAGGELSSVITITTSKVNYPVDITATSTTSNLKVIRSNTGNMDAGDIFEFDNISVKEVGVAGGWTTADAEPLIPQTALMGMSKPMVFDGINNYVDIPNISSSSIYTVSSWVNISDSASNDNFVIFGFASANDDVNNLYYWGGSYGNKLGLNTWNGDSYGISGFDKHNQWVHIVAIFYDSAFTSFKLYINGASQTVTQTEGTTLNNTLSQNFGIGYTGHYTANQLLTGSINEVSVFNTALNLAQVQELFNDGVALDATTHSKSGNLRGYWRNDGASKWTDRSGNSNNGIVSGSPDTILLPEGTTSGKDILGFPLTHPNAGWLEIDGTSNYVDVGSSSAC